MSTAAQRQQHRRRPRAAAPRRRRATGAASGHAERAASAGEPATVRSISSATISFGLVTVPVRVFAATAASAGISFHLLHKKDGVRLRQQLVCPEDGDVVRRTEAVKGYEFEKDHYVTFTDEELKALDEKATQGIEITEFVPLASVDARYFERSYYLAPDKGGAKAFSLLSRALSELALAAVGQYAARGKDYLVLLRPLGRHFVMHQLYHADELRPLDVVPTAEADVKEAELKLARSLIEQLTSRKFEPEKYVDRVRNRIRELIARKVEGEDVTAAAPPKRAEVIDLMDALKASLERKGRQGAPAAATRRRGRARARSA
jgi:DNA end-binding protein Ku